MPGSDSLATALCQHRLHVATTTTCGASESSWRSSRVTVVPGAVSQPELGAGQGRSTRSSLSEAPLAATIRIDSGASLGGFSTPTVELAQGGTLSVINFDGTRHSVTSDDHDANGVPLFSVIVNPGATATGGRAAHWHLVRTPSTASSTPARCVAP